MANIYADALPEFVSIQLNQFLNATNSHIIDSISIFFPFQTLLVFCVHTHKKISYSKRHIFLAVSRGRPPRSFIVPFFWIILCFLWDIRADDRPKNISCVYGCACVCVYVCGLDVWGCIHALWDIKHIWKYTLLAFYSVFVGIFACGNMATMSVSQISIVSEYIFGCFRLFFFSFLEVFNFYS